MKGNDKFVVGYLDLYIIESVETLYVGMVQTRQRK